MPHCKPIVIEHQIIIIESFLKDYAKAGRTLVDFQILNYFKTMRVHRHEASSTDL